MQNQRDHYIDLIRGICVIGIIFIHTCFHSGYHYVPMLMRSFSLLLDVPAFFFISGMTVAYVKKDITINSLFKLSMVFTLLSVICNGIYNEISLKSFIPPLFLHGISVPKFFVSIGSSYWFIPVFACTIIFSSIIIKKFENKIGFIINLILGIYCLSFFQVISMPTYQFLGCKIESLLFPTACYLLGYYCRNNIVNSPNKKDFAVSLFLVSCLAFFLCYVYSGNRVFDLQANKFPFKLPYIIASFLSMSIFIFFYDLNKKNKFFEHLGRNAIYYYAGQGVSSSILYVISPYITFEWGIKLPIMFVINVVLAILCSELLRLIYELITCILTHQNIMQNFIKKNFMNNNIAKNLN